MITTYTESGPNIGMGHVKRVERLKGALENAGLGDERIDIIDGPFANSRRPEWNPKCISDRIRIARNDGALTIVLTEDYQPGMGPWHAMRRRFSLPDLTVDTRFNAKTIAPRWREWKGCIPALMGPRYAMLGEEYRPNRHEPFRVRDKIHNILVFISGPESVAMTKRIVETLHLATSDMSSVLAGWGGPLASRFTVSVVLGAHQEMSQDITDTVRRLSPRGTLWTEDDPENEDMCTMKWLCRWSVETALPSLIDKLRWADIAIMGGGQTLFEAARMGVPPIVVRMHEDQIPNTSYLAERGLAIDLGTAQEFHSDKLLNALEQLDCKTRLRMHRGLRRLVDGRGTERIVREVKRALKRRRR